MKSLNISCLPAIATDQQEGLYEICYVPLETVWLDFIPHEAVHTSPSGVIGVMTQSKFLTI